jgi:hypothetical protein
MNAYTVFIGSGRIGTYHTREKAEQVRREVIANVEQLSRIAEWTPEDYMVQFVTFDDDKPIDRK